MKRCPECRRDYYDDSLLYCLDDGNALLDGPAAADGPATAIYPSTDSVADAPTQIQTAEETLEPSVSSGETGQSLDKRLIAIPLAIALIVLGGSVGYRYFGTAEGSQINSIAVLPFTNASGDKESEFLSDGIAETLINNFTKIPELKVAARSTAFRYRGREDEPKEIGRELGVGSVLTGRLLQRGDNINIQVDLVNASDGLQIWGNGYQGTTADIVNIQQRIAADVSAQLKLKLTGAQERQISTTYTQNANSYQHYLRGRYYWNKRTAEDLRKGLQEFQAAADGDPNYALAYVGLADTYVLLEEYAGVPSVDSLPQARAYAEKALQIDNSLGEAHATSALIYNRNWQWAEADREFRRAIELNPNYPTVHHWLSINLRDVGRIDESMAAIKRAQELDPLSAIIGLNVAIAYMHKGDYTQAVARSQKVIELDPNWWGGHHWLGTIHLKFGHPDEALTELQRAVELSDRASWPLAFLAYTYGTVGRRSEAISIVDELKGRYARRESGAIQVAAAAASLGDTDVTFQWLNKAAEDRSGELMRIMSFPCFDALRDDERYRDLVRRMNLPEWRDQG